MIHLPPVSTRTYSLFPYTTLFRSLQRDRRLLLVVGGGGVDAAEVRPAVPVTMARAVGVAQRGVGQPVGVRRQRAGFRNRVGRSEEHTSELQSLMRISYAVFCLKKKK